MRERSKSYAYICAHWQSLSPQEHRNCYKGVTMEAQQVETETDNPEIIIQSPTSPREEMELEKRGDDQGEKELLEDFSPPEPKPKTEEEMSVENEQESDGVPQEDETKPEEESAPGIPVENKLDSKEELPQEESSKEELPPPPAVVDFAEIEMRLEKESPSPFATDLLVVENSDSHEERNSERKSSEMVEAVSNFQQQMASPSQEKDPFELHNEENSYQSELTPTESSPEPLAQQAPQDEADKELESELIVHEEVASSEPAQENLIEISEEKLPSPVGQPPETQVAPVEQPPVATPEPPKEEKKAKPTTTGMKTPTARAAPKLQAAKAAAAPVTSPPKPAAAKRAVPALTAAPKPSPMSRPPPPARTAPRPVAPRSQSHHRTPTSKNGSTNRLESLPNTPKLVNKKYQNVTSKIGSITDHKPTGGNIEIFSEKKKYNVTSKIGSLEKADHKPGGGNVKIESQKLAFKDTAKPRIDAASNHTPKGGNVKIPTQKLNWNVQSKVGSLDNATHKAGGGQVKILNQKLEWNAESKVGSKDNIQHRPGGGNIQIFDEKLQFVVQPKIGSLDNADHVPGGGNVKVI